jgi:hypothetical protein
MKHILILSLAAWHGLLFLPPLRAEENAGVETSASSLGGALALKVGGTFHTVFTGIDPAAAVELEGGLTLLGRRLELDLAVGWAQAPASSGGSDARLGGEDFHWKLYQDFLYVGLVVRYRFLDADSLLNVYAAGSPRVYLLRTMINGASGEQTFGENRQYETRFGGALSVGGELNLGPGAIMLEFGVVLGDLDGLITGNTSSSSLDLFAGYRFLF